MFQRLDERPELEGESHEQAAAFVAAAENITSVESVERRLAVIACGETSVTLHAAHIEGGPNQEFALAAALAINGRNDVVVGAIDVDGTDGPTEASGGLVDGGTVARAAAAGLDAAESLRRHAASTLLNATGDWVITGPTGTNVSDLMIFLASH